MTTFNLDKSTTTPVQGKQKLHVMHKTLNTLQPRPVGTKSIVLIDTSGSMHGEKLIEAKKMLHQIWSMDVVCIAFDRELWEIESMQDINALQSRGSTAMQEALEEAWKPARNARHIVLITDGHPDGGPQPILQQAHFHREIPIDTIGVADRGYGHSYDPAFLRELAAITGGKFTDCGDPLQLTSIVQNLLLAQGSAALKEGGAIQL